jgi:AcrR family transcriptional regulator
MSLAFELSAEETTNRRIVAAAMDCILERGFYRASSNEIARRAGMTWGAIQYYFGTREKLMLAALEVFNRECEALLERADIGAGPTGDRLEELALLLARQYGRPQYLAALQIVLNLAHNPQTSQETAAALVRFDKRLSAKLMDVISASIGPGADAATVSLVFHASRGLAVSHLINSETSPREFADSRRRDSLGADLHRMALALGRLIDGEG